MRIEELWQQYGPEPIYMGPDLDNGPYLHCPSCRDIVDYLRVMDPNAKCESCDYKFPLTGIGGEIFCEKLPNDFVPMLDRPLWDPLVPDLGFEIFQLRPILDPQRKLSEYMQQTLLDEFAQAENLQKLILE